MLMRCSKESFFISLGTVNDFANQKIAYLPFNVFLRSDGTTLELLCKNKIVHLKKKYMKTIFTLLLSSIFSVAAMAYDGARLTVSTLSTSKMFVEVDGRRYNLQSKTLSLANIRPGDHTVRVLQEKKGINGRYKREEVVYSIKLSLRNGYHFDILVNRFGKTMIDERRIEANNDWYDDEDYYDKDDRDWDRDNDRNNGGRDDRTYDNDRDDRNDRDVRNDRDEDDYNDNYRRAMRSSDFTQAKETIRKEWFENTRLTIAKQIIDRNYFTSQQVKEMVLLFTFENNRLDIAKYAYGKTVDKGNYFIINDAFTFSNNKESLSRYIREYK